MDRNFINWNPHVNIRYRKGNQSYINLSYNGSTQQPAINQIQPVLNNSDNLNIYAGNPNLKPYFRNNFDAYFNNFKLLKQRGIWIEGSYSFITHPIVSNIVTNDTTGKSVISYSNINTMTANYNFNGDYSRKWKKFNIDYDFSLGLNGSTQASYINNELNTTKSNAYNFSLGLSKFKENKFNISMRGSVGYTYNNSMLQNQIKNNYWNASLNPYVDISLPAQFEINSDGNYTWQQKTQSLPTYHQFIWNAWIGKNFFKKKTLLIKVSANDILNQNNGYSRQAYDRGYQQSITSTIRRYYMLSVVWNFTKMDGTKNQSMPTK